MFDAAHDKDFVAALALHSHKRDQALHGPGYVSARTRGLLWYYNHLARQEHREQVAAGIALGVAGAARESIAGMIAELEAGNLTEERRRQIYAKIAEYDRMADGAGRLLDNG